VASKLKNGPPSPCDSPLLQRNHSPSDVMIRNLGLIERDTTRRKANRYSRNNPTGDEQSAVLRNTLEDGTDDPDGSGNHDGGLPSQDVG
jgi:hypothetical protein